jgi:hypothetical protein
MHLVHNERTKLTSAWFNALGAALTAAGSFAPLAALLYGLAGLNVGSHYVVALGIGCLAGGFGLHVIGRAFLGRLRE